MSENGRLPIRSLGFPIEKPNAQQWLKNESRTWIWTDQFGGEAAVFKLYRRRQPWHTLRCALTRYRVEREYRTLRHLTAMHVPCSKALGWACGHSSAHGFFELLIMRDVSNSGDLQLLLKNGYQADFDALFALARSMHVAGVCSQVLVSRNVLVADRGNSKEFVLIDFPRAHIFPRSVVGTRVAQFDLIMLIKDLTCLGFPPATSVLTHYGMTHEEARRLLAAAATRRTGKYGRRLADVECRFWHMLALAKAWGRGSGA